MSNVKLRARRSRLMGGSPFQRGYSSVGRDAITPTRVIESGFALSWPLKLDGSKNLSFCGSWRDLLPQLAESIGWSAAWAHWGDGMSGQGEKSKLRIHEFRHRGNTLVAANPPAMLVCRLAGAELTPPNQSR